MDWGQGASMSAEWETKIHSFSDIGDTYVLKHVECKKNIGRNNYQTDWYACEKDIPYYFFPRKGNVNMHCKRCKAPAPPELVRLVFTKNLLDGVLMKTDALVKKHQVGSLDGFAFSDFKYD
jgi:hypothetical protein